MGGGSSKDGASAHADEGIAVTPGGVGSIFGAGQKLRGNLQAAAADIEPRVTALLEDLCARYVTRVMFEEFGVGTKPPARTCTAERAGLYTPIPRAPGTQHAPRPMRGAAVYRKK